MSSGGGPVRYTVTRGAARYTVALGAALLIGLAGLAGPAAADDGVPLEVVVEIEPASSSVTLGDTVDLLVTVSNRGPEATQPLTVHIDILAPDRSSSVDPEDWTSTLNRELGVVAPGGTAQMHWTVQPISAGTFVAYAVALPITLPMSGGDLSASKGAEVVVVDRRSLNPGNIVPLAVAAPVLVGGLLGFQLRRARRSPPPARVTRPQ
jgi:hypothetical protein